MKRRVLEGERRRRRERINKERNGSSNKKVDEGCDCFSLGGFDCKRSHRPLDDGHVSMGVWIGVGEMPAGFLVRGS